MTVNGTFDLGLATDNAKPPRLVQPQAMGLYPSDLVVQALINGASLDTTAMTPGELANAMAASPGPVTVTVLQVSRVASTSHKLSWPVGQPPR